MIQVVSEIRDIALQIMTQVFGEIDTAEPEVWCVAMLSNRYIPPFRISSHFQVKAFAVGRNFEVDIGRGVWTCSITTNEPFVFVMCMGLIFVYS